MIADGTVGGEVVGAVDVDATVGGSVGFGVVADSVGLGVGSSVTKVGDSVGS